MCSQKNKAFFRIEFEKIPAAVCVSGLVSALSAFVGRFVAACVYHCNRLVESFRLVCCMQHGSSRKGQIFFAREEFHCGRSVWVRSQREADGQEVWHQQRADSPMEEGVGQIEPRRIEKAWQQVDLSRPITSCLEGC